ncbi:unnamed protein product [Owenia fusiformis]|uniref:Uncharacterized protein n=1 Tax=Owenia fusiformis TaxID=6347 RepID=A0A8J1UYX6_OWEFU|nr:unnamed protein product [Owenia fusiformis]
MSVEKFEISLEHDIDEQYQYQPGETLRGAITIRLAGTIRVKIIQIQIKGEASVSWDMENVEQSGMEQFRSEQTYVDVSQPLITTIDGESMVLDEGNHAFPFEYELPANIPSSFIGKYGSITYVVRATLKEAQQIGLGTLITSEPFLVLRTLDLARDTRLLKPISEKIEKRFWGFCISGKVSVFIRVNRRGHVPGEDIFIDADITNSSPRIVRALQASLVMRSEFHAKRRMREFQQVVNRKRDEWEMTSGEGRRWRNVRLTIPPYIPESLLSGCDIMEITYELVFVVEISGDKTLNLVVPITIGTEGSLLRRGTYRDEENNIKEHTEEIPGQERHTKANPPTARVWRNTTGPNKPPNMSTVESSNDVRQQERVNISSTRKKGEPRVEIGGMDENERTFSAEFGPIELGQFEYGQNEDPDLEFPVMEDVTTVNPLMTGDYEESTQTHEITHL